MNGADFDYRQEAFDAVRAVVPPEFRVETMPEVDQTPPYVFVGRVGTVDHPIGFEMELTIETWADANGRDVAHSLQKNIRDALHGMDFTTDDWAITKCRELDSELILDADRETWHGTQTFRALASQRSFV